MSDATHPTFEVDVSNNKKPTMARQKQARKYTMPLPASNFSYHHPAGGPHIITAIGLPIPRVVYARLAKMIESSSDYTYMEADSPEYARFMEAAQAIIGSAPVTAGQILALRSSIMKNKVITRFQLIARMLHDIAAEYGRGVGILTLSQTYDFPPLHLMRAVLRFRGSNKIAESELTGRDLEQFQLARAEDITSGDHDTITAAEAASAEAAFVDRVRALGIPLKDQADLTAEQELSHGRAIITPDILFTEPVRINGADVHWIDYKNYVGADIQFLRASNRKQAARYTDKFGPGAFAYSGGFVEGVTIPGAIMLDARAFM